MEKCYCGSDKSFENCCKPFIEEIQFPKTPEELMRSRYSAYAIQNANYLMATTHISQRKYYSVSEILEWSKSNTWVKLEVITAHENRVEFKAYYLDEKLQAKIHHEHSTFQLDNNKWFYVDGEFLSD
ncbi:YchJ family protein [Flavobacterium sp. N2270]|uniref:YchJ family protein n=1 Tax=Flavobacterium sp. N2270 TaxID=2986831 RepID=UPI0022254972|nr:YchJ family metal-binding protein [Flavobacterium sp. N2270]